jgi:DNA-directed RNA polymerase subunit E'/Rpb7
MESKYLDSKIHTHIKNKLEKRMIGQCTFEDGYVTDIIKILKFDDNYISPATSSVIFNVKFKAKTLKPEEGKNLKGEVCMVFQHGIFVEIDKKMKILIPVANMLGFIYNNEKSMFELNKNIIKVGDILTTTVIKIKYEKKEFSCIGSLIYNII